MKSFDLNYKNFRLVLDNEKEKLESILERYRFIQEALNNPEIVNDVNKFKEVSREFKRLSVLAQKSLQYIKISND